MNDRTAERQAYVRQFRAVMDPAGFGLPGFRVRTLWPPAGRRMIRQIRDGLQAVVADLRALTPPADDRAEIERHVLEPLDRQVAQWDDLVAKRRTVWWLVRHPEFGDEQERPEDVEFRLVYGLEDPPSDPVP